MYTIFLKELSFMKRPGSRQFSCFTMNSTRSPGVGIKLFKFVREDAMDPVFHVNQLTKNNPNCAFIFTTPSQRKGQFIKPGHTATWVTDKYGNRLAYLSKRNSKEVLCVKPRAYDSRFNSQELKIPVRLFKPRYTSPEEELATWKQSTEFDPHYPLYIHIIPLQEYTGLTVEKYKKKVDEIMETDLCYSLFSYETFKTVKAQNCNEVTWRVLMDPEEECLEYHDMSCQEMVVYIMRKYMQDQVDEYMEMAKEAGLLEGIEKPELREAVVYAPVMVMG